MKLAVKLMLVAMFGVALPTAAEAKDSRTLEVSRATVEKKCGGDLQSGGGAIGCTVACPSGINGKTCDYSCGGPAGDGCRVEVFSRVAGLHRDKGQMDQVKVQSH
jgi:hypothetical protein